MCFASDSCGHQIILLQHTEKKLLLNVPVPRNKVYKEKSLYQVLEHILKFAMNISKKGGKPDELYHVFSARETGCYMLSPDRYLLMSRLLYDVQ